MDEQRRYFCRECKREWIEPKWDFVNSAPCSITGNPKGDNCPVCGSPEIQEVSFRPLLPGLDIPRSELGLESSVRILPNQETVETIPGLFHNQSFKIKAPPALSLIYTASSERRAEVTEIQIESTDDDYYKPIDDNSNELTGIFDQSDMD